MPIYEGIFAAIEAFSLAPGLMVDQMKERCEVFGKSL
jgi:hypothetical protein